jgi:hypothetical protein
MPVCANLWHLRLYIYIWVLEIGDRIIGGCKTLLNQELYNFFFPDIIRIFEVNEYEIGRACSTDGEKMNACKVLAGKP